MEPQDKALVRKGVVVCLRGGAVSPMFLPHLQITIPKEGDAPEDQVFYSKECALLTHELEKQCRDGNFANMAAATLSSNPYATADAAKKARLDAAATVLQALVCLPLWDTGRTHIVREDRN